MVMNYRSSAGYTPLDFAFVVAGSKGKGVVEMLDRDHQLLPRDTDSTLEKDIIEVWKQHKVIKNYDCFTLCCQFQLSKIVYNINSFSVNTSLQKTLS